MPRDDAYGYAYGYGYGYGYAYAYGYGIAPINLRCKIAPQDKFERRIKKRKPCFKNMRLSETREREMDFSFKNKYIK